MKQIALTLYALLSLVVVVSGQEVVWLKEAKNSYHLSGLSDRQVTASWKSRNGIVHLKLTVDKYERSFQLVDAVELARVQYDVFGGDRKELLGKIASNFGGNKVRVEWLDGAEPSVINLRETESDQVFPDGFSLKSTYSRPGYVMPALSERNELSYLTNAALLLFLHTEKKQQTDINSSATATSLLSLASGK